jgi:hypothetical protein
MAVGAVDQLAAERVRSIAIQALQGSRLALKVQLRARTDRVRANHIPIELHGIIDNAGQLADDQMHRRDPHGMGLLGMLCGNVQNTFCNG